MRRVDPLEDLIIVTALACVVALACVPFAFMGSAAPAEPASAATAPAATPAPSPLAPDLFPITIHESRPAPTPESPEGNADASQDATQPDGVPGRDLVRATDIAEQTHLAAQTHPAASVLRRAPYEVTVYTQDWCLPCRDMKARAGNGNADIRLTWVQGRPPAGVPEVYPALCWRDRNGRLRYVNGALPLSLLQAIIERNDPPPREVLP